MPIDYSCTGNYSTPTPPPEHYGAIAHEVGGTLFSWAFNHKSRNSAVNAALDSCEKDAKSKCEISMLIFNQCFAIASNSKYYATSYGNKPAEARERALRACRGDAKGEACKIVVVECGV